MRRRKTPFLVLALILLGSCTKGINYTDPAGPRYAGSYADHASQGTQNEIRLVTYNIKFARHVDRAIALLQSDPGIKGADLLFLQEMDEKGTREVAQALRMNYVYYPATLHPQSGRDFGNAILSRWPIEADRKLELPHLARFNRTLRNAVTGIVRIGGHPVRATCVHIATPWGVGPRGRRDQVRTILDDARRDGIPAIIAGDFNSHALGTLIEASGYRWPTKELGPTASLFDVDHIFLRGLSVRDSCGVGVARDGRHASDHRPVWAVVRVDDAPAGAELRTPGAAHPTGF